MRMNRTALIIVPLLLAAMLCAAQTDKPDYTTLSLSSTVSLTLGMPEAEVFARCANLGLKKVDNGNGLYFYVGTDPIDIHMVAVRNGRLVFATRSWAVSNSAPHESIVAALKSLSRFGDQCSLQEDPNEDVNFTGTRINISCGVAGLRSLLIVSGRDDGKPTLVITESIGHWNPEWSTERH